MTGFAKKLAIGAVAAWVGVMAAVQTGHAQTCPARKQGAQNARILGGLPADIRNWPGMVVMRTKIDWGGEGGLGVADHYFCGGSLINKNWVLTAAHCVYGVRSGVPDFVEIASGKWAANANTAYVRNAPLELFDNISNLSGATQPLLAERIVYHADYNPETFANDIALIKLKAPAKGATMRLAAATGADPSAQNGWDVWVAGFGKVSNSWEQNILKDGAKRVGTGGSVTLQEVGLPARQNFDECVKALSAFPLNNAKQLCVGLLKQDPKRPKDSCGGDSGGPLVRIGGDNCPVQVGLVSFGPSECAEELRPAVYTRISAYNRWIRSVIGAETQVAEVRDNAGAVAVPAVQQAVAALAPGVGGRSDTAPAVRVQLMPAGPVTLGTQRQVKVTATRATGYVIVGDVDAEGTLTYLAPNNFDPEPKLLKPGESLSFGTPDQPYQLTAVRPVGKGFVFAIITPDKSLSDRLRLSQRARGVGTRGFVAETREKADDEFTGIAESVLRGQMQPDGKNKWIFGKSDYEIVE